MYYRANVNLIRHKASADLIPKLNPPQNPSQSVDGFAKALWRTSADLIPTYPDEPSECRHNSDRQVMSSATTDSITDSITCVVIKGGARFKNIFG